MIYEEGRTASSASPHGRTRMTVFPARRSVALKVATASSRAGTLPMFVRSRPSRTRPRPKTAVPEQSLPRGEARDWQARAHREVDVARQRREIARLDGYILRQGAVAMPVGETEHALS